MANCYRCGKKIEGKHRQQRRKVKTGEWVRRRYSGPTAQAAQTHYGMRIVCQGCARRIDLENSRIELVGWLQLGLALAVLYGILIALALR